MAAYLCQAEPGLLAAVRALAQWTWQLFFCIFADKKQSTSLRYREISPNWLGIVGETVNIPFTLLFEWASKLLCALFYSNSDLLTCPLGAGREAQGFQWHFIIWVYSTLISARVLSALFFPASSVLGKLMLQLCREWVILWPSKWGICEIWHHFWGTDPVMIVGVLGNVWVSIYQQRQLVSSSLTALVMSQLTPHPQHTCLLMSRWVRRASPWTPAATWCHQTWPEEVRTAHNCTSSRKLSELTPQ